MQADPEQRVDLYPAMKGSPLVEELDSRLEEFFDRHSAPQYDLWREGVSKGIPPKPFEWVLRNPWPWLEKYWRDFVWRDSLPARFQE